MKKKKFIVTVRQVSGTSTVLFSRTYNFSSELDASKFFYSAIGSFLYSIDDIVDIYKTDTEISQELTIFCRGFYRQFTLLL